MTSGPSGDEGAPAAAEPTIERFLGDPTRDLGDWRWLWDGDRRFPIRSAPGALGKLKVLFKKLLRPFVVTPQQDLWERQRIANLIVLEYLQRGEDIRRVVLETHAARLDFLETVWREGLNEVMGHNDALFARVDQKVDQIRRDTREVWAKLGAAIAAVESVGTGAIAEVRSEQLYLELERRHRGTEQEIRERIAFYLPRLRRVGEVLDLGCGRGEALQILADEGIAARGVDGSAAMVAACREKGLRVEQGDLFETLAAALPESLGAVVSFHVVEHLPPETIDRLVRLTWRALLPGGLLILETPNPLSLVVGARNFWLDPTHRRPVHPESLALSFEVAGFDPVERLELHPFADSERLPEVPIDAVAETLRPLAERVNRLRDQLDDLLFGAQDYALIGTRPGAR